MKIIFYAAFFCALKSVKRHLFPFLLSSVYFLKKWDFFHAKFKGCNEFTEQKGTLLWTDAKLNYSWPDFKQNLFGKAKKKYFF